MDCDKHKKMIEGYNGSIEDLAKEIGNLHYEELAKFCVAFSEKLREDGNKDLDAGRGKLGNSLLDASIDMEQVSGFVSEAWKISKPFMK